MWKHILHLTLHKYTPAANTASWLDKRRHFVNAVLVLATVLDYNMVCSQGLPNDKKVG